MAAGSSKDTIAHNLLFLLHEAHQRQQESNTWLTDKTAHVYFCGPMPFMAALKGIGFTDDQLHYEVFGPTTELPTTH